MKSQIINQKPRTFALVFQTGDEVMSGLKEFARENHLHASQFTAIGALRDATLGFFDWETRDYEKIPIHEQVEVLSLLGDVTLADGGPQIHAHIVLGKRDGTGHGGHLLEAHVRPTLEVILTESPGHLHRAHDDASGLALIKLQGRGATRVSKTKKSDRLSGSRSHKGLRTVVE